MARILMVTVAPVRFTGVAPSYRVAVSAGAVSPLLIVKSVMLPPSGRCRSAPRPERSQHRAAPVQHPGTT
jgi:hypothetical protein